MALALSAMAQRRNRLTAGCSAKYRCISPEPTRCARNSGRDEPVTERGCQSLRFEKEQACKNPLAARYPNLVGAHCCLDLIKGGNLLRAAIKRPKQQVQNGLAICLANKDHSGIRSSGRRCWGRDNARHSEQAVVEPEPGGFKQPRQAGEGRLLPNEIKDYRFGSKHRKRRTGLLERRRAGRAEIEMPEVAILPQKQRHTVPLFAGEFAVGDPALKLSWRGEEVGAICWRIGLGSADGFRDFAGGIDEKHCI